ncbi:sensor histidine kinase [Streptomyces sp. NPDC048172]|uniref:sensor histidine kinase n=1 Tax=Streptomyces sp. NPDC048172 TaxID=3365505 RepID=UPI00372342DC
MRATASDPAPSAAAAPRVWHRWSARMRLTLLYGSLFLVSGMALLGFTYFLVARSPANKATKISARRPGGGGGEVPGLSDVPPDAFLGQIEHIATEQHDAALRSLLTQSGIALACMTALSVALGWLVAGRVLRPVRLMADKARSISERNLHERLAVSGPADELKDLGDTFDGLLARLDAAFEAQRRFVANASHELRTPLTLQRATIEVALSEPDPGVRELRDVCRRVLAAGESQERLIEALLTLASGERGLDLDRRAPLDLAEVAGEAVRGEGGVGTGLARARTHGDAALVGRLAANLVENARRYTPPGGWIHVHTGTVGERAVLHVANSGPPIPAQRIPALFQPFQRLDDAREAVPEGHGLGLSIVAAIARAHGARLHVVPGPEGGLAVTVAFPR